MTAIRAGRRWRAWIVALACTGACGRIRFDASGFDASGFDASGSGASDSPGVRDADPRLLAYYPMDNDPTGGALDGSIQHRDATCTSCPSLTVGARGGAFQFDGIANALFVPFDSASNNVAGTIALWVRLDAVPSGYAEAIGKPYGAAKANSWELTVSSTSSLYLDEDAATASSTSFAFASSIGTWTHLAATWGSTLELYVDGVHQGGAGFMPLFDSHPIQIGADTDFNLVSGWWRGAIDEVRIYDQALSAAEIATLATQ